MAKTVSLDEFYESHSGIRGKKKQGEFILTKNHGHFNVFSRASLCHRTAQYNRRDFYKVSLIIGTGRIHYANKSIEIDRNALLFSNPFIPYSWEAISEKQEGYFCLFTQEFFDRGRNRNLNELPFFIPGENEPVYFPDDRQTEAISAIFENMLNEIGSDYKYKFELLGSYLDLIIHEALKLKPADSYMKHKDASTRITSLFLELLERQFPVDSSENRLNLKSPNDFACNLAVHVNHLNRAVKKITGKTTTQHIAARIASEAKALLQNTDWNISDISYVLGFEYQTHFNSFFKKQTGLTPHSIRP